MVRAARKKGVEGGAVERAGAEANEPGLPKEAGAEAGSAPERDVADAELRAFARGEVQVAAEEVEDPDRHLREGEEERRFERDPAPRTAAEHAREPAPLQRIEPGRAGWRVRRSREGERAEGDAIRAVRADLPRRRRAEVRAVDERDQAVVKEIVEGAERGLVERVGAEDVVREVIRERRHAPDDSEKGGRDLDREPRAAPRDAEAGHVARVKDGLGVVAEADDLFRDGTEAADAGHAREEARDVAHEREEGDAPGDGRQREELSFDVRLVPLALHGSELPSRAEA